MIITLNGLVTGTMFSVYVGYHFIMENLNYQLKPYRKSWYDILNKRSKCVDLTSFWEINKVQEELAEMEEQLSDAFIKFEDDQQLFQYPSFDDQQLYQSMSWLYFKLANIDGEGFNSSPLNLAKKSNDNEWGKILDKAQKAYEIISKDKETEINKLSSEAPDIAMMKFLEINAKKEEELEILCQGLYFEFWKNNGEVRKTIKAMLIDYLNVILEKEKKKLVLFEDFASKNKFV